MIQTLNKNDQTIEKYKIVLPLKIEKSFLEIAQNLADLGITKITKTKTGLEIAYVISEDSQGQEYESIKINLTKNDIALEVSAQKKDLPKRKLEGWRFLILVLGAIDEIKESKIFANIAQVLAEAIEKVDASSAFLISENQNLKEENAQLRKKLETLYAEKELLTKRLMQDSIRISELKSKLDKLLEIPDEVIQDELLEWLKTHNGKINITEFAMRYSYQPSRIMQNLDALAKMGKITKVK